MPKVLHTDGYSSKMDGIWDMHQKFIQNETTVYTLLGASSKG